jgi:hypothetical protein
MLYPIVKANIIKDCLGNQFRAYDLRDCDHRRNVEAQVEALMTTMDENIPVNFRSCDISREIQFLKLGKASDFDGIPNECHCHLPGRPLVHLTYLFTHCLRLGHFPATWKKAKFINMSEPGKDPNFPENLCPTSLLSTTGELFGKLI